MKKEAITTGSNRDFVLVHTADLSHSEAPKLQKQAKNPAHQLIKTK